MAEVFATVASGAGLASLGLQLVECAVKLQAFCNNVEKAPRSLNRISREINTFALLLRQIDDTRARYGTEDSELLLESMDICAECTQEIVLFTSRLEAIMRNYRTAGIVYSALRMRDVRETCADLERAKNSLMIAFQAFYHRTQVRMMNAAQHLAIQQSIMLLEHGEAIAEIRKDTRLILGQTITSRSRRSLAATGAEKKTTVYSEISLSELSLASDHSSSPDKLAGSKRRNRTNYQFRIPLWYLNKILEVTASRSLGRWQVCLQTYNQQPAYSPVVAHYLAGRVEAVRELFRVGQASPYDVYGYRTPLELTILSGSVDMFRFLQSCEFVNGDEMLDRALRFWIDVWSRGQYDTDGEETTRSKWHASHKLLRIVDCLIHDRRTDVDERFAIESAREGFKACPSALLPFINRRLTRPHQTLTAEEKFAFLHSKLVADDITPNLFNSMFPDMEDIAALAKSQTQNGSNATHLIAKHMGEQFWLRQRDIMCFDSMCTRGCKLGKWQRLLDRFISAGCDLHVTNSYGNTPLRSLLTHAPSGVLFKGYQSLIRYWAKCLRDAGVDLVEYGKEELARWREPLYLDDGWETVHRFEIHVVATGFEYGATANEWHLSFHGEIEIPRYTLEVCPGSWPRNPLLPQEICWIPPSQGPIHEVSSIMDENGDIWIFKDCVVVHESLLMEAPEMTSSYSRLLKGTQDDSLAVARSLSGVGRKRVMKRRRHSQPSSFYQSGPDIYVAGSKKSRLQGYLHYCPLCSKRIVSNDLIDHYQDHMRMIRSETYVWTGEPLVKELRAWAHYIRKHGIAPVACTAFGKVSSLAPTYPSSSVERYDSLRETAVINPLAYYRLKASDFFEDTVQNPFCSQFPGCIHQQSYLDYVRKGSPET